jgi:hypothetical protein
MKEVDSKISDAEWLALEKIIRVQASQTWMNGLVDQGGSESALNVMRPYILMSAQAFTINMTKLFDIQGEPMDRIRQLCYIFDKLFGFNMIELETQPNRFIRVGGTNCECRDNPRFACVVGHEMFINTICETVCPDFECRFMQMIPNGDPLCSYVIEKKKK